MLKVPPRAISANMVLRVLLCNCFLALAAAGPADQPVRIVVLGDSLVAGFGLASTQAFPAQLERALRARGHAVEVINAGVSGDTTAGGLQRVGWSLPDHTDAVILELGANDALLLAAGELRGEMIGTRCQADLGEQRGGRLEGVRPAGELQRQRDVLKRRHGRDQMEGLEDDAD